MTSFALGAHRHQNLKFSSARCLVITAVTAEHGLAERGGQRVIVEVATVLVREHRACLAYPRDHVGRQ
jgi:hypothetical protein